MQKYLQWKDKSMAKKEEKEKESYKLKEDLFSWKKISFDSLFVSMGTDWNRE